MHLSRHSRALFVIPGISFIIPATFFVIPAQAGISLGHWIQKTERPRHSRAGGNLWTAEHAWIPALRLRLRPE